MAVHLAGHRVQQGVILLVGWKPSPVHHFSEKEPQQKGKRLERLVLMSTLRT